ncbi:MAG: bifunctional glycosyltransferase family 2/GtrA family protein [Clostridia bacterium]|nr:bifunctional glycosyltransferase family 2/GtrA family protein [Clostridia bacterium]
MLNITVVIPTLNPSEKIFDVVTHSRELGFDRVIIVNDGSRADRAYIFDRLEAEFGCEVLTHEVNRGKGRALKTAMEHFLADPKGDVGIVTLDDDGQHTAHDTVNVAQALINEPDKLVLGVRDFNSPNVPPKSKWGNKLTAFFMRFLCGVKVSDTQTGLRAIPLSAIPAFIKVSGERFEYETNMLLATKDYGIGIKEVTIDTVYIEGNSGTHFHPIRDSLMIYKQLFAYVGSAVASAVIEYGLFTLLTLLLPIDERKTLIYVSKFIARFFSSIFNFFTNKKLVFGNDGKTLPVALRYYTLCIVQTILSSEITTFLSKFFNAEIMITVCNFVADAFLAIFSYRIQRGWVFAQKNDKNPAKGNDK